MKHHDAERDALVTLGESDLPVLKREALKMEGQPMIVWP